MNKYIIAVFVALTIQSLQNIQAQDISKSDSTAIDSIALQTVVERDNFIDSTNFLADNTKKKYNFNSTIVKRKSRPWLALAEDIGVNAAVFGFDYLVQDRDYSKITSKIIKNNFKKGFVWDNDSFSGNQFSHPFHGSMFYNAARDNGLTYWQSLPYPILGSSIWEFFCETNKPAINDLLSTGIGGSVFGEITHRTSDIIFDDSRTGLERVVREIAGSLINPIRGLRRLITGQSWRVRSVCGYEETPEPYNIGIASGTRYIGYKGLLRSGQPISYVEFKFDYGDRFDESFNNPYDLFHASILFNTNESQSTVGDLDFWGRICDKKYFIGDKWKLNFAGYQMMKYVETYPIKDALKENFPIISEAVSFGMGLYAEYKHKKIVASNDLVIGLVPLGGFSSDYFFKRTYNFASGLSLRENISINIGNKILIADKFYYARFFVLNGYTPERLENRFENDELINRMGDKGNCYLFTNKLYAQFPFIKKIKIDVESVIHYRSAHYKYYPKVSGRSYEFRLGLSYTIKHSAS